MLKVDHVTKYYGEHLAVDDLSFEIHEGEIFGLLGVNGAGKTTTFRMIMGLLDKTKGDINIGLLLRAFINPPSFLSTALIYNVQYTFDTSSLFLS